MPAILLGLLQVCLTCAVIVLVAFVIVWVLGSVFGIALDGNVKKWGQIVVALLCIIVIASWLFSVLGGGVVGTNRFLWRW